MGSVLQGSVMSGNDKTVAWLYLALLIAIPAMIVMTSGCTTTVYETKEIYVKIDEDYISPCTLVAPPAINLYKQATPEQRNVMWSQVYLKQLEATTDCNLRLDNARKQNARK